MKKLIHCTFIVALAVLCLSAHSAYAAYSTNFIVGARTSSEGHDLSDHAYNTGVSVKAGQSLSVTVDPASRWSVATQTSGWRITADGVGDPVPITGDMGTGSFNIGTLVGYVLGDDGTTNSGYMGVGTAGLNWNAAFDGTLFLVCWDTYFANNFHTLSTNISVTPIPGALWLFATGLAALAGLKRKITL
jgi:hypothetical protein